ncbi:MAG: hypothetical protein GC154_13935 [bacterium]|nr:hypothetical protein [bacterium]
MTRGIFLSLLIVFAATSPAWSADEKQTVEQRLQKLEEENAQLRSMIEKLQERLNGSANQNEKAADESGKKKKKKDGAQEDADSGKKDDASKKDEPAKDESKKDAKEEERKDFPWLPSLDNEYFQLGGRLRFGYFDVENEKRIPSAIPENPGGTFDLDEFRLELEADFSEKIRLYTKFDAVHESSGSELTEAYVEFSDLPFSSTFTAGLQEPFYRPSRDTRYYPLAGRAFWRDRDLGVIWKSEFDPVYVYGSFTNGLSMDDQELGQDDSAPMISIDRSDYDFDNNREFSGGVGVKWDFGDWGDVDLMGFGVFGRLGRDDISFLQNEVPGYGVSRNASRRWAGVNLEYDISHWDFFAQAIHGRDGELQRFAWYLEGSYKFDIENIKYLKSLRPLVRYGEYDTNLTALPYAFTGSLTWNRQQWLFALITEITNDVYFHTEYAWNLEDTGGPDVDNNEVLFLLEVEF